MIEPITTEQIQELRDLRDSPMHRAYEEMLYRLTPAMLDEIERLRSENEELRSKLEFEQRREANNP